MAEFIHDLPDWPRFLWNHEAVSNPLAAVRHRQGRLIGRMESLGFQTQGEAVVETLTEEVVTSNEIEGDHLNRVQVRSSLARRLGVDIGALNPPDRHVEGVVDMTRPVMVQGEVSGAERNRRCPVRFPELGTPAMEFPEGVGRERGCNNLGQQGVVEPHMSGRVHPGDPRCDDLGHALADRLARQLPGHTEPLEDRPVDGASSHGQHLSHLSGWAGQPVP